MAPGKDMKGENAYDGQKKMIKPLMGAGESDVPSSVARMVKTFTLQNFEKTLDMFYPYEEFLLCILDVVFARIHPKYPSITLKNLMERT